MRQWLLILALLVLVPCNCFASRHHRSPSVLAATKQSVPLENAYANRSGNLYHYPDQRSIERAVEAETLLPITVPCSPALPVGRRYALPATVEFMVELDSWFMMNTGHHLTVDSAVRSVKDQRKIRRWNRSAAPATGEYASTHERGTTVDLSRRMSKGEHQFLVTRLLYYRAIGRILVIEERRCIHVFVIGDHDEFPGVRTEPVWNNEGGSIEPRDLYPVQGGSAPEVHDAGGQGGIPFVWIM